MLHHHLLLLSLILFLFGFTSSSVTVILLSSFLPKLLFLSFIKRYLLCHLRLVLSNCTFPSYYPTKGLIWLPMSSIPCVLHVTLVSSSLHLEKCKRIKLGNKISTYPTEQPAYLTLQTVILRQQAAARTV
jgi:hypothetical protein